MLHRRRRARGHARAGAVARRGSAPTSSGMSSARSRSGGMWTWCTCDAVVQVVAELARRQSRPSRSMLVAATKRTSTVRLSFSPTRRTSPDSSARSSFACRPFDSVPISSRKSVPPSACSMRPARAPAAPVNAPLAWPKSSASSSDSVSAAQLTATNALDRARAAGVNRARGELLSRAGLAGDEHRPRRRGGAPDQILHLRHRAALADERVERRDRLNLPLQQVDLARELAPIDRRSDAHQQLVAEERLLHEVDGAELHGLDRGVDRAEAGHDDEGRVHAHVAELAQHVDAGQSRHPHVGQDHVEARRLAPARTLLRRSPATCTV